MKDTNSPKFLGNWQFSGSGEGRGYAGATWDINYIAPTLTTMQGGNRQPMIVVRRDK